MRRRRLRVLALLFATVVLSGCYRFQTLRRQARRLEQFPRIEGELSVEQHEGEPLVVLLLEQPNEAGNPVPIIDRVQLFEPGSFSFVVPMGHYQLTAFVDANQNLTLDGGERFVQPQDAVPGNPTRLSIDGTLVATPQSEWPQRFIEAREYRLGDIIRLDDPLRGPRSGPYGTWQPIRFMARYVNGIYFLEEFDPNRTPVLFVHGMGGYPQQFEPFVERLDEERFQPWVVHYASALPISRVAEWINRSLNELQTRHGFERLCVVGHSMGGLVAREVANLHVARSGAPFLRGIVTIAAPLGGLDSAQFGVDWSPSVAPSWRDLAPESGFLRSLYRRPLPDYVAYDLLFTFHETEGDDTVVDIRSQLREEAQREANRVRGFEATHAGVLESGSAWEFIEANLNDCVGSPL